MKKNRLKIFIILITVTIIIFSISQTIAYFFGGYQSPENIFKTSEWVPAETEVILNKNGFEYKNKENIFIYQTELEEKYLLTYNHEEPQFLSFKYKLETTETAELFDSPSLVVFANEIPLLQIDQDYTNETWQTAYIDLSKSKLETGEYELTFKINNTFDDQFASQLQISEVTTTKFFARQNDTLSFLPNKEVSQVKVEYLTTENDLEVLKKETLTHPFELIINQEIIDNKIWYSSTDLYNNEEEKRLLAINLNNSIGAEITNLATYIEGENELSIQLTYQNNLLTSSEFSISPKNIIIKISQAEINSEESWQQAISLQPKQHKQFLIADIPTQTNKEIITENLLFQDVPFGNYYLAVRLCDQVGNCSDISSNESIIVQ